MMTAPADRDDDRYFLCRAIERIIGDSEILEAKNGEEALDLLRRHLIQLVIMDMNMPGLSGLETGLYSIEKPAIFYSRRHALNQ